MIGLSQGFGNQTGFTLIELMVVLTISALLLMVVVPRFSAVMPGIEFRKNSAEFTSVLRLARSRAIETQSKVVVEVRKSSRAYKVVGTNIRGEFMPDCEILQLGERGYWSSSEDVSTIAFFPNGTASAAAIKLVLGENEYLIRVEWLNGVVTIEAVA